MLLAEDKRHVEVENHHDPHFSPCARARARRSALAMRLMPMNAISRNPMGPGEDSQAPESGLDERELVARMLRGEQHAFDRFFEIYAARIGAFAARRSSLGAAELEDVVQVTMIKAMRGLSSFRGGSSLFTWLCQICRNQLADLHRKAGRQPRMSSFEQLASTNTSEAVVHLTDFHDPLDECVADSTGRAVRQVVNRLPADFARILELRFGDELTVPQIARILGLSESAAESRLTRARRAFRDGWTCEAPGVSA
jgi:RNA polymerase sigma factor (sigma-70 family)